MNWRDRVQQVGNRFFVVVGLSLALASCFQTPTYRTGHSTIENYRPGDLTPAQLEWIRKNLK